MSSTDELKSNKEEEDLKMAESTDDNTKGTGLNENILPIDENADQGIMNSSKNMTGTTSNDAAITENVPEPRNIFVSGDGTDIEKMMEEIHKENTDEMGDKTTQDIDDELLGDEIDEDQLELKWEDDSPNPTKHNDSLTEDLKENELNLPADTDDISKQAETLATTSEIDAEKAPEVTEKNNDKIVEENIPEDAAVPNTETDVDMAPEDVESLDKNFDTVVSDVDKTKDIDIQIPVEVDSTKADKPNLTEVQLDNDAVPETDKHNLLEINDKEIAPPSIAEETGNNREVDAAVDQTEDNIEVNTNIPDILADIEPLAAEVNDQNAVINSPVEDMQINLDSPMHIKTNHKVDKPDVMLEIPTQELIDIDDEFDSGDDSKIDEGDDLGEEIIVTDAQRVSDDKDVIDSMEAPALPAVSEAPQITDAQPSTSTACNEMTPDTSDEVPEMSDSLGLLAESSRVMDDDEEQDDDEDNDDDDDFDQDESSNQMTAEQSEDSNTGNMETDTVREEGEREAEETTEDIAEEGVEDKMENTCEEEFEFTVNDVRGDYNDDVKIEAKTESEKGDRGNTQPLLPEIKTASQPELKIKEEKEDSVVSKRVSKKEQEDVKKPAVANAVSERDRTSVESATDDVIEHHVEIETVKLSDDEDTLPSDKAADEQHIPPVDEAQVDQKTAEDEQTGEDAAKIEDSQPSKDTSKESPKSSPNKLKNLTITSVEDTSIVNIVDLEESSSEDDTQLPQEPTQDNHRPEPSKSPPKSVIQTTDDVTTVNLPTDIDIMSTSGGNTSEITVKEGEVVISGVPKPPPHKPARLNTGEVTIKTASTTEQTLVIPETKINDTTQTETKAKPKLSLEIFSLDSDEEDTAAQPQPDKPAQTPEQPLKKPRRCLNSACTSGVTEFIIADTCTAAYYDTSLKKKPLVCQPCADAVLARQQKLVEGIKNMTPLLELDMVNVPQDLVEILDSESDDEDPLPPQQGEPIGEVAAEFLEKNLADLLNKTWKDYKMDDRLTETQDELNVELKKLEDASKEINQMLIDCQHATDKLRQDFYSIFEPGREEVPPLLIYETPEFNYIGPEVDDIVPAVIHNRLYAKRKMSSSNDSPAKRPAIPLGYTPLEDKTKTQEPKVVDAKADEDKDISVVKLSAESAPPDLPPPGELTRPPLRVGMQVFAMKNAFGPWLKGKIIEIMPKTPTTAFTLCRVKFDHKVKNNGKILPARCIAYAEPANVRMTIGTRLIALFKDSNKRESYYSGVVAEIPNPVNSYRYLVFFDDGYAQYVHHPDTRLVCECFPLVWEEVHPFSREFVREYLMAYPERPMVRLHEGQHLKTEWDGKWWSSRVGKVDASLAQVIFTGDGRREWIYRGSTRLAPLYLELRAAERHRPRPRPVPRTKQARSNMPYVEYTRHDEQAVKEQEPSPAASTMTVQQNEEMRRQRAVARKSTALPSNAAQPPSNTVRPPPAAGNLDVVSSRVVYYTPKNAVRPHKLVPHKCSPKCKRTDVLSLKELRTYNPLAKPLLSGWERQIVRFKGQREVMYRAPCGRRLRDMRELHRYLRVSGSELPVDLFDFHPATHCLAEFVLNKCLVGKKDLSHGKENVPVPCVNYYDETLPEFCSYNTERTPTSGVPLNLDPEFLCGCDCTDDCQDKEKCACWQMTLEGARTIGLEGPNIGYEYKRLPEPLPSGIYECNSRCKCKETCLNRVAQHPLQLKLQVFKTLNRGWGIRALNDVPKGAFLCVYAGNLLTDATANLDGLNEGDEYLAELDYIEVVEQMKEGYEEDIPEADKKLDKKDTAKETSEDEESSSSEDDDQASKSDKEDDDFLPGSIGLGVMEFNKRLRRRGKNKNDNDGKDKEPKEKEQKEKDSKDHEEDCITISDDEEIREPSRFTAQPGMTGNDFVSKYRSVRSYFGEDEACYIMDAKVQGNIGRYLNHSCSPNVFVQNVFVDTHDPRFPWVAFFALSHIKAGTELTWNYNYDVGSVPGKVLYCYCEAPNCRGRLL